MADDLRYLADTAEAIDFQPEPLGAVTSAKLTIACDVAEDEVDKYMAGKGITTSITLADLDDTQQDQLKRATAKMVEAVLYSQHNLKTQADKAKAQAEEMLDEFIAEADLGHTTAQTRLGIANYQEEYIDDWNDPNSTLENMDE